MVKKGYICLLFFLFSFSFLFISVDDIGITWDEPIYISHTIIQARWLLSPHPFLRETILRFWPNETHPPFGKILILPGILFFSPFFDLVTSARIPIMAISSLLIAILFLFVSHHYGKIAGIFAALSLLFIPRLWGHFHLASLGVSLTFMVFLASIAFYRGIDSRRWCIASGVLWGLALSTKSPALLFILPLFIWAYLYHRKKCWDNIISLILISPVVFFLLWPRMWFDTGRHFLQFLFQQVIRIPIPVYYFSYTYGETVPTPWHYPIVMLGITIPVFTIILTLIGTARVLKEKWKDQWGSLSLIVSLFFLLAVSSPFYSKYDGIRLFLPVLPFLVCLAAKGFQYIQGKIEAGVKTQRIKYALVSSILLISIILGLISIVRIHPFYLSYYNILIGGIRGAHRRGMESTYWGDAINNRIIQFINEKTKTGAKVAIYPLGCFQIKYLRAFVREDIELTNSYASTEIDYFILHCRQGMFTEELWNIYRLAKPIFTQSVKGVPLVKIYEKKEILPFLAQKTD